MRFSITKHNRARCFSNCVSVFKEVKDEGEEAMDVVVKGTILFVYIGSF